jgi:hypothetical protein
MVIQSNAPGSKPCGRRQKSTYAQKFEKSAAVSLTFIFKPNNHVVITYLYTLLLSFIFQFLEEQSKARWICSGK